MPIESNLSANIVATIAPMKKGTERIVLVC